MCAGPPGAGPSGEGVAAVPDDVEAGQLHLDVVADITGFRADAQKKIDAAVKGVRAKIQAELDANQLRMQAEAAARSASEKVKVQIKVEVDRAQARREIATKVAQAAREIRAQVTVQIKVDAAQARAAIREVGRDTSTTVTTRADVAPAEAEIDALRQEQERRPVKVKVSADTSSLSSLQKGLSDLGGSLFTLGKIGGIASGVLLLAGGAVNLAGGLFAVAAAGSQAVGVLAALPGIAVAAGQGIGALLLGFHGIGAAVSAMGKAQTNAAKVATQSADTQRAAADAQRAAVERLRQARQSLADATVNAVRQEQAAEWSNARSMEAVKLAQQDLNDARETAKERIEDLAMAARSADLSEQGAEIALIHATKKLNQTLQSSTATDLEKREAKLAFEEAKQKLAESKDQLEDVRKDKKKADKKGVEGSDEVASAKRRLRDAIHEQKMAEQALADAKKNGARQIADAQRSIADAQRSLANAQRSSAKAAVQQAAGISAVNAAMAKLSPAGRTFARFIAGTLMPRLKTLRWSVAEAILPPMQRGITRAMPFLDTLQTGLTGTGKVLGHLGEQAGKFLGSKGFNKDFAAIMKSNNKATADFGSAGGHLFKALINIMWVARPLVERFAKWAKTLGEAADKTTGLNRENGKMAKFFERAWDTARKLKNIIRDVTMGILAMGHAATPSGNSMLDSMVAGAAKFREWANDTATQERLKKFFDNAARLTRQFADSLGGVGKLLGHLAEVTGGEKSNGLLTVLNGLVSALDAIVKMPGGGKILNTIFFMSGAALGLGLVAKALGGILKPLKLINGLKSGGLLSSLFGGGKSKRGAKDTAKDIEGLTKGFRDQTSAINDELPRDGKKSTALELVGKESKKTAGHAKGLTGGLDDMGKSAEKSAVKSGRFSRMLGGLGKAGGKVGKVFAGLATALLDIPGLSTLGSKLSGAIKGALTKIKMPKLSLGGGKGATGGISGFFKNLGKFVQDEGVRLAGKAGKAWKAVTGAFTKGKLPGLGAMTSKLTGWFTRLGGSIAAAAGKVFKNPGKLFSKIFKSGAKGGAKGGAGGPLGIIGGILAGIIGDWIGGDKGGARGAAGGAISGAATGAGIGGMIGALFAGVGAPIGAAIGAGIGAVIGAITGGKWWGAIGTFFTTTLPKFIGDQAKKVPGIVTPLIKKAVTFWWKDVPKWAWEEVKKLPGALLALLGKVGGLAVSLGKWAGKELKAFGKWLGKQALKVIENLPALIVKALFAIPVLISKAMVHAPSAFAWLAKHWAKAEKALLKLLVSLPGKIWRLLVFSFTHIPSLFGWLGKQSRKVSKDVLGIFGKLWSAIWKSIKKGLGKAGVEVGKNCAAILVNFSDMVQNADKYVRKMVAAVINAVRSKLKSAVGWVSHHLSNIGKSFNSAKTYVVDKAKSAFAWVADHAKTYMNKAKNTVLGILGSIRGAFREAVGYIGKVWSGIQNVVAKPVRWIGNNVYNRGIKAIWDKVAGLVGIHQALPAFGGFRAGGITPGYTPGRDPHKFFSPTGGTLEMSGGEAVMVPEWTRAMGSARVHRWNAAARAGGPGAAAAAMAAEFGGGHLGAFSGGGILGTITGAIKKFGGAAKNLFSDGLVTSANWVLNPILGAAKGAMGGSPWGDMLTKVPAKMISGFVNFLAKTVDPKLGGNGGAIVKAAVGELGQGEQPAGSNNTKYGQWYGINPAAWCDMFISYIADKSKTVKAVGKHSYVPEHSAAMANRRVSGPAKSGDLAVFGGYSNPYHIGLVEKGGSSGVTTIEGNHTSIVQRVARSLSGMSLIRPKYATGGVTPDDMRALHMRDEDPRDSKDPLTRMLRSLPLRLAAKVSGAVAQSMGAVTKVRDGGGPVSPGLHMIRNGLSRDEWMLVPEAVDVLGGPRAVAELNASARNLYRSSRGAAAASARVPANAAGPGGKSATVNVYPQPRQSEDEIGASAARRLGALL